MLFTIFGQRWIISLGLQSRLRSAACILTFPYGAALLRARRTSGRNKCAACLAATCAIMYVPHEPGRDLAAGLAGHRPAGRDRARREPLPWRQRLRAELPRARRRLLLGAGSHGRSRPNSTSRLSGHGPCRRRLRPRSRLPGPPVMRQGAVGDVLSRRRDIQLRRRQRLMTQYPLH
jgi:hypothetical protein